MSRRLVLAAVAAAVLLLGVALAAAYVSTGSAGDPKPPNQGESGKLKKPITPKYVKDMLKEVDPANIENSISTLAGFGTRHTLSSQTDPVRGIGAARDWLYNEFQKYAADSGGRMTVEQQSYTQTISGSADRHHERGGHAARNRSGLGRPRTTSISGHYDSRCGNTNNATCDAPGANDDASGVAAVLELARVMSKRPFESTLVFMAVAGEEQNLYGSARYATLAQAAGLNIEGMFTNDIIGSSVGGTGSRGRAHGSCLQRRASRRTRRRARRTPGARSAARTTRRPVSSPAS